MMMIMSTTVKQRCATPANTRTPTLAALRAAAKARGKSLQSTCTTVAERVGSKSGATS